MYLIIGNLLHMDEALLVAQSSQFRGAAEM